MSTPMDKILTALGAVADVVRHNPTVRKASVAADTAFVTTLALGLTDGFQVTDVEKAITAAAAAALFVFKAKANKARR